jgi:hypothetical protein
MDNTFPDLFFTEEANSLAGNILGSISEPAAKLLYFRKLRLLLI